MTTHILTKTKMTGNCLTFIILQLTVFFHTYVYIYGLSTCTSTVRVRLLSDDGIRTITCTTLPDHVLTVAACLSLLQAPPVIPGTGMRLAVCCTSPLSWPLARTSTTNNHDNRLVSMVGLGNYSQIQKAGR